MIFDKVVLSGSKSLKLFDLTNPLSTPYTTRTIDGLGPTDVDVTLSQTTQGTGIYVGRREQLREITLNLYLNPDYTIGETPETLRERIYMLQPVNNDMSLDFALYNGDDEVAYTPVYIKRIELSPFGRDSTMVLVLASTSEHFYCRDADRDENPDFSKTQPIFENKGTVPTGFRLEVKFNKTVSSFGLYRSSPDQYILLGPSPSGWNPLAAGHTVVIDTTIGERKIWVTDETGDVNRSGLSGMTQESSWVQLQPGENVLQVVVDGDDTDAFEWVSFEHQPKYRGV